MRHAIILGLTFALATGPALAEDFEPSARMRAGLSFGGSTPTEFNVNGVRVAGGEPETALNARDDSGRGERIAITSVLATVAGIVVVGALASHIMGEAVEEVFEPSGEQAEADTESNACGLELAGQCVEGGN